MDDGGQTPVMGDADRAVARELSRRGARPPAAVPGYEHAEFLGHGAYGEVWVAVSRNTGRKVAIKFYTRRGGLDWGSLAREVEKLRYLFSDRYVVQLFEVGWEADPPYYVMEFMENGSLEDLLRHGPLTVHDATGYFREIAVALVHAHNKGILHCDLKPGNVLLDHDRRPRLADFGQARLTNEMSPALGTLYYMAPEQADLHATPDARWDVYALGAVMYRMLTGRPPHYRPGPLADGNLDAQLTAYRKVLLTEPKPAEHRRVPGADAGLAGIIDRCLEPSPSKRYPNPQAVVTALDAWSLRRVRRPLLALTGCGFALLMGMLAAVGAYLFWTSVNTAERGVVERAVEGNRFAARAEAQQMALETEHRWRVLEFEAADPRLRGWLTGPPDTGGELDVWLAARRAKYNRDFPPESEASVWMALDRGGHMRGMDPPFPQYRNKYYGFRDYFTGAGYNSDEQQGPPRAVISAPHRSVVYRRRSTGTWAVTFSVPVPAADPSAGPVGVLAMSIDLQRGDDPSAGANRFTVLVDTRPDGNRRPGLVVRHPYMGDLPAAADEADLPLYYADELVALARDRPPGWERLEEYRDPVGGDGFGGAWLAVAEPVVVRGGDGRPVDTGFVVVVQERRADVLRPVRDLQWRLGYMGALAATLALLLVTAMWFGMTTLMDNSSRSRMTRVLRRWAGLPTGGTAGTGTAVVTGTGIAAPGGKTVRPGTGTATPAPGQQTEDRGQRSEDRGQRTESPEPKPPPADTPRD